MTMLSSSTFGQINFPSSRVDGVDHDDNDGKIDDEKRYRRLEWLMTESLRPSKQMFAQVARYILRTYYQG